MSAHEFARVSRVCHNGWRWLLRSCTNAGSIERRGPHLEKKEGPVLFSRVVATIRGREGEEGKGGGREGWPLCAWSDINELSRVNQGKVWSNFGRNRRRRKFAFTKRQRNEDAVEIRVFRRK